MPFYIEIHRFVVFLFLFFETDSLIYLFPKKVLPSLPGSMVDAVLNQVINQRASKGWRSQGGRGDPGPTPFSLCSAKLASPGVSPSRRLHSCAPKLTVCEIGQVY